MKMKYLALLSLSATLLFFASCKKDIASGVPKCVKSKIQAYNDLINVDEFFFQGKTVYTFSTDIADDFTYIYDESCALICQIGGFAGISNCNSENFYQAAIFKRNIWKKK